jgi:hypothetical protein
MAEIEPGLAGSAAPTETVVRDPGPPPTDPGGATPPPAAGGRSRNALRWGAAFLALALVVGVVAVAAAVLGSGSTGSAVRGWLPTDTVVYLEIRADLPGDQRAKVGDILARFPGFADQASLDAKIDEALNRLLDGSGSSWTQDIKPWLGGEIGIAVTGAALDAAALATGPQDGAVAIVAVKDGDAAAAWLAEQVEGDQQTTTYEGGDLTIVAGPSGAMAWAVRDGVLVLGPETTVKASLDTAGSSSIVSSESFAAALETAPAAYLGYGYVDMGAIVAATTKGAGGAGLPATCLEDALASVPAWAAGSMAAESDMLVFTTTAPVVGDPPTTKASASAIASRLPGATVVAVEVRDFGPSLVAGIDALKKQLGCDPSTAQAVDQLDQALTMIGGLEPLVGWADDAAIAVEVAGGTPGGGLAATVSDEEAAGRALDQVRTLLALGGAGSGLVVREEPYADGNLLVIEPPSDVELAAAPFPPLAATVQDGVFVFGTLDFVKHVLDTSPDGSLASADAYKRAIAAAGGDGVNDLYVDIAGLVAAAEAMLPPTEKATWETEVKPFLAPFEAFASVTEAPGSTNVSRSVITFTE